MSPAQTPGQNAGRQIRRKGIEDRDIKDRKIKGGEESYFPVFNIPGFNVSVHVFCPRFLLDEAKPLDPSIASPEINMVADSEMRRINIEFPSNLARLVRMLHEDKAPKYFRRGRPINPNVFHKAPQGARALSLSGGL
jgi:hypothetical protein